MPSPLAIKTFTACAATLYFKFLITTGIQGGKTFKSGGRAPEDNSIKALAKGNPTQNFALDDTKDEKIQKARAIEIRWRRLVLNDLESIPLALIIFIAGILAEANEIVLSALMVTYTIARIGHSIAFAHALQPHRAIFWFIGVFCIIGGAVTAVLAA